MYIENPFSHEGKKKDQKFCKYVDGQNHFECFLNRKIILNLAVASTGPSGKRGIKNEDSYCHILKILLSYMSYDSIISYYNYTVIQCALNSFIKKLKRTLRLFFLCDFFL